MRITLLLFIVIGMILCGSAFAEEAGPLIGDESDGSRAVPVHLIPLLDEEGIELAAEDDPAYPFSTRQTCATKCHNYQTVTGGWHFNATNADAPAGRPGHPWILTDAASGTQIPLSYREWPGTYKPKRIGLSQWDFVKRFGRHTPGGGAGEFDPAANPGKTMRIMVSGKLEANCLACHDADPAHDQGEYAGQIARENFRWAAASTSGFANASGLALKMPDTYDYLMPEPPDDPKIIPPGIEYRSGTFDTKKRVFFDVVRKVLNHRCYFCHSSKDVDATCEGKWTADEDVHIAAGLACVDCHRNGLDHNIVRGYAGESETSGNPLAAASSCEGCHVGDANSERPEHGRLGAPVPQHRGIPTVHFERMACTACHSGPWPGETPHRVKTSLAHGLGMHNANKADEALPHIQSPVFAKGADGKIAPFHLVWPAFWGTLVDNKIEPIQFELAREIAAPIIAKSTPSTTGDWTPFDLGAVRETLDALAEKDGLDGQPVYVCGGKVYRIVEASDVIAEEREEARPYLWPVGHDVRPAAQSLGVRGCGDCHSLDAPFFFGEIDADSPLTVECKPIPAIALQGLDPTEVKTFALSFKFRPLFKVVTLLSAGVIGLILLFFALMGVSRIMAFIAERFGEENE